MDLSHLTDRLLLELIYTMLLQVYAKINDDSETLAINMFADLLTRGMCDGLRRV